MRTLLLCLFAIGAFTVSFAQPPNDNCSDAIAIAEVTDYEFSTVGANTDGPFHPDLPCPGNGDPDSLYNDIWYQYTASFTGNALWTLCGTADFDTKIAVYNPGSPCPPADGDLLTCNEDAGSCANLTSELIFAVAEGQTYLLRLAGFGEEPPGQEGSGTFSISEFISAVPNDFCKDALDVSVGEDQPFATTGATTDGPDHPGNNACFGFGDISAQNDIWYTFTPDFTGAVEWSTCNSVSFDTRLVVYGPNVVCPVSASDLYACNDDGSACSDYSSRLIFDVEEGNTYLLRIGGYDGQTGSGTFDLVNTTPPEPPSNDLCENAMAIEVLPQGSSGGYEGTTINATFDPNTFQFPTCLSNQSGEFAEVWYSFNSGNNTSLDLIFGFTTPEAGFYIDLWNSCASGPVDTNIIAVSCEFTDDIVNPLSVELGEFPGEPTDYIMRITTRVTFNFPGDFFFQLLGDVTSSTNELPAAFESITLMPNPVQDVAVVNLALEAAEEVRLAVYDIAGVRHWVSDSKSYQAGISREEIRTNDLPAGMYLLRVDTPRGAYHLKFIKS